MNKRHHEETIDIEVDGAIVPIDAPIAPLVRWLASIPGIHPRSSCQGGPDSMTQGKRPHVMFAADNVEAIDKVASTIDEFGMFCAKNTWAADAPYLASDDFSETLVDSHMGKTIFNIRLRNGCLPYAAPLELFAQGRVDEARALVVQMPTYRKGKTG